MATKHTFLRENAYVPVLGRHRGVEEERGIFV
jgi:hypothetical protein